MCKLFICIFPNTCYMQSTPVFQYAKLQFTQLRRQLGHWTFLNANFSISVQGVNQWRNQGGGRARLCLPPLHSICRNHLFHLYQDIIILVHIRRVYTVLSIQVEGTVQKVRTVRFHVYFMTMTCLKFKKLAAKPFLQATPTQVYNRVI